MTTLRRLANEPVPRRSGGHDRQHAGGTGAGKSLVAGQGWIQSRRDTDAPQTVAAAAAAACRKGPAATARTEDVEIEVEDVRSSACATAASSRR